MTDDPALPVDRVRTGRCLGCDGDGQLPRGAAERVKRRRR